MSELPRHHQARLTGARIAGEFQLFEHPTKVLREIRQLRAVNLGVSVKRMWTLAIQRMMTSWAVASRRAWPSKISEVVALDER